MVGIRVGQFTSSEPSPQSSTPSQCQRFKMQCLLLHVNAYGEQVAPGHTWKWRFFYKHSSHISFWKKKYDLESLKYKALQKCEMTIRLFFFFTWICTVGLISLVYAVYNSITAEGVRSTTSFITLKGIVSTEVVRRDNGIILDAVSLIGLQFHAVRTATHSTERRSRKAKVAAAPVGHRVTLAFDCC